METNWVSHAITQLAGEEASRLRCRKVSLKQCSGIFQLQNVDPKALEAKTLRLGHDDPQTATEICKFYSNQLQGQLYSQQHAWRDV